MSRRGYPEVAFDRFRRHGAVSILERRKQVRVAAQDFKEARTRDISKQIWEEACNDKHSNDPRHGSIKEGRRERVDRIGARIL
jgi:hypothetical protein